MPKVARLRSATFYVEERDGELWNRFELRLTTPEGDEVWDTGWGCYGAAAPWAGKGLRAFETQMQDSFENHMYDLARRGLTPDREHDELPVEVQLSDALRTFIGT